MSAARLAERVARESYGRLLAMLAARTRDLAAAEDALAEAFAAALSAWPRGRLPEHPEAWPFAAAKRKLIDISRRAKTAHEGEPHLTLLADEIEAEMQDASAPDRRLGLMFACANPEIEAGARTPLMLQAVLGLSAEAIASAYLMDARAMSQRLVRAKAKIRDAGIGFEVPEPAVWPQLLAGVLDAIYAAYNRGWSDALGADPEQRGLADEAVWLGRVLAHQVPGDAESLSLLALMLHLEARRPARRSAAGEYVPLELQDPALWRGELIEEADALLIQAGRHGGLGRYQVEAAIQSAHAARRARGQSDWAAIVTLYDALARLTGSPVARLNHAAALARTQGAKAALALVEALTNVHPSLNSYQPYWALRADLLAKLNLAKAARVAYDEAIARERDAAVIRFLSERRARL